MSLLPSFPRMVEPGWNRDLSQAFSLHVILSTDLSQLADQFGIPPRTAYGRITLCVALGASFVVMVILIDRFVRSSPPNSISLSFAADQSESDTSEPSNGLTDQVSRTAFAPVPSPKEPAHSVPPVGVKPVERPVAVAVEVEPVDVDPPTPVTAAYTEETLRKYLPEWALAPVPARVEGPWIQVRRVTRSREPTLFPSLRLALNETKGTIEIADDGPFPINDFRVPGEFRLICAAPASIQSSGSTALTWRRSGPCSV